MRCPIIRFCRYSHHQHDCKITATRNFTAHNGTSEYGTGKLHFIEANYAAYIYM